MYVNRTYYDGFTMRDVSYKSGDHIYCLPGDVGEEMYLAQIDSIFEAGAYTRPLSGAT